MILKLKHSKSDFNNRIIGLDIIRSFAILLVLYSHSLFLLPEKSAYKFNLDGVNLFFVLSGFLVGKIIFKEFKESNHKLKSIWKFWVFRWVKTLPSYFLVFSILYCWTLLTHSDTSEYKFSFFYFGQNFYDLHPQVFKEAWSLSVEEWFYLLFPLFLILIFHFTKNLNYSFLILIISFIFFSQFLRFFAYQRFGMDTDFKDTVRKIVVYRFDGIMFGVLLFYLEAKFKLFFEKYKIVLLILGLMLIVGLEFKLQFLESYEGRNARMSIETFAVVLILPFFSRLNILKITFLNHFFLFISKISYALYLVNLSLVLFLILPQINEIFHIEPIGIISYLVYWVITFVLAYLLYYIVEKPLVARRNFLAPK